MVNRYLQDRASRRVSMRRDRNRGYEQDYARGRGQGRGRGMDRRDYSNEYDRRDMYDYARYPDYSPGHEMFAYGYGQIKPREEYDYRGSYDYSSDDVKKEYEEDLQEWIEKLKHKDRFKVPKDQVIKQAKNMGIHFVEYSEEEFYAIYLAMVSDYKTISNDYNNYIRMAKDFLEDDDMAVSPSEKVCIYLYEIVLGGK